MTAPQQPPYPFANIPLPARTADERQATIEAVKEGVALRNLMDRLWFAGYAAGRADGFAAGRASAIDEIASGISALTPGGE